MLENNIQILKVFYKHRGKIFIASFGGGLIIYFFTFLIQPIYRSEAVIYPANLGIYSEESQTEQMLQYLNSNEIRTFLFAKLQLFKHYHIDTTKKNSHFKMDLLYDKNVSIRETKFESIELKAEDTNPDTALLMVKEILKGVDTLVQGEHRKKYAEDVKNASIYLHYKSKGMDSAQAILNKLSTEHGVIDMRIQLKEAARSYYKEMRTGTPNPLSELLSNLGKHGTEYLKIANFFENEVREYTAALNDYQKKMSELQRSNSFVVLASHPTYPFVYIWPKRSVICLTGFISIFIFTSLYFIFIEKIKSVYVQVTGKK